MLDARDICRRLYCSPITLSDWVDKGCPIERERWLPFAHFEMEQVKQWLTDNNISDWPKENDQDLDRPVRVILKALHNKEITPWKAERIIINLGSGIW